MHVSHQVTVECSERSQAQIITSVQVVPGPVLPMVAGRIAALPVFRYTSFLRVFWGLFILLLRRIHTGTGMLYCLACGIVGTKKAGWHAQHSQVLQVTVRQLKGLEMGDAEESSTAFVLWSSDSSPGFIDADVPTRLVCICAALAWRFLAV